MERFYEFRIGQSPLRYVASMTDALYVQCGFSIFSLRCFPGRDVKPILKILRAFEETTEFKGGVVPRSLLCLRSIDKDLKTTVFDARFLEIYMNGSEISKLSAIENVPLNSKIFIPRLSGFLEMIKNLF